MDLPGVFESLEKGDRILFNDRKIPLEVEAVDENRVHVEGPQGGEYIIFPAEDDPETLLVASKGSREYASRVANLRKAGKWEKIDEDTWKHSREGSEIEIEELETGFWKLETDLDVDLPKYGFASRKFAEEEARKLMERNPEA